MTDSQNGEDAPDPGGGGRRQGDRRQAQQPFDGPDRRKGDRRSGKDRRTTPRDDSGI
jgi:hypothetical protein